MLSDFLEYSLNDTKFKKSTIVYKKIVSIPTHQSAEDSN